MNKVFCEGVCAAPAASGLRQAREQLLNVLAARGMMKVPKPAVKEYWRASHEEIAVAADIVREYLRKVDFSYTETVEQTRIVFSGTVCAECDVIDVFQIKIVVDEDGIQSFLYLPTHVKPDRRRDVAEYCMHVNYPLRWGKLAVDIDGDGQVMYYLSVPVAALKGDPDIEVDRLIGVPTLLLEQFVPGLIDVLKGRNPRDAYDECDRRVRESINASAAESSPNSIATSQESFSDDASAALDDFKEECAITTVNARGNAPTKGLAAVYSLDGLNVQGDVPLSNVVWAARKFRGERTKGEDTLSILLSGPPGCGKTAFVDYLCREIGAEVLTVTASDVMSPMVGRTEQKLADLFRWARESESVLFMDEIDSFLSSRANAYYSWEVMHVNELLQQMERFGGIMVGATNFESNLDSAVARRFTFKLKMDYLSDEGKQTFFARYFETPLTSLERARLETIPNLTPGDFKTARQKLYYLPETPSNETRLAALEAESVAKGARRTRIGF